MFRIFSWILVILLVCFALGDIANVTQTTETGKCADGYVIYNESCYNFHNKQFSWTEAMVFCRLFAGHLVALDSPEEYAFLRGYLSDHGKNTAVTRYTYSQYGSRQSQTYVPSYWIGATAMELPGHWMWVKDRSIVDFTRFGGSHPGLNQNDCLVLNSQNGHYHATNMKCNHREYFICERER